MDDEGDAHSKRAETEGGNKKIRISRHSAILYYSVSEILSSKMQVWMRLLFQHKALRNASVSCLFWYKQSALCT